MVIIAVSHCADQFLFLSIYRDSIFVVVGDTCCVRLPGFIPSVSPFLLLLPEKSWKVCEANWPFTRLVKFVMPAYCEVPLPVLLLSDRS